MLIANYKLQAVALAGLIATLLPVHAATIFSNLGPGDSFGPAGVGIGFIPFTGSFVYAGLGFTPAGQDYFLDTFELPVRLFQGANELDVFLMSESAGVPGAVIESYHLSNALPFGSDSLVTIVSISRPLLGAATQYWVVAAGGSPTTFASWRQNSINEMGPNVSGPALNALVRNPDTNVREALRVSGTAVPEPGSSLLILSSLLTMVFLQCTTRRTARNSSQRISA